ncbi:hypothetical protein H2201_005114 [Coniosporium apollinis]|uniref:C2H2-type domain-containing protein n=1 Tax=Coniosporium apollinis TaxID=61459 RepID=A0ABQ9NU20_9PEZI|nr:hypothetical protein H2201_005114 [Coniosporium apollinis]
MDVINFISKAPGLPDAPPLHPGKEYHSGAEYFACTSIVGGKVTKADDEHRSVTYGQPRIPSIKLRAAVPAPEFALGGDITAIMYTAAWLKRAVKNKIKFNQLLSDADTATDVGAARKEVSKVSEVEETGFKAVDADDYLSGAYRLDTISINFEFLLALDKRIRNRKLMERAIMIYTRDIRPAIDRLPDAPPARQRLFKCPGCMWNDTTHLYQFHDLFKHIRDKYACFAGAFDSFWWAGGKDARPLWFAVPWPRNFPLLTKDQKADGKYDPDDATPYKPAVQIT